MTPWPPVTFAWVQATETVFGPEHQRFDEDVVSVVMNHSEGNFPSLNVTIRNRYRGLIGPDQPAFWAWMGYVRDGSIEPFYFGRLIATPDNIQDEFITVKLLARSRVWLKLKQHQADLLRSSEPYDPIFVDANKRADPDVPLEFISGLYHYGRVPEEPLSGGDLDLQVSVSDYLTPEDGYLVFQQSDHFYKSFNYVIGQQPLTTLFMKSDVSWLQTGAGLVNIPTGNVDAWTGGSIISAWPKPGHALQGGYTVASATAFGNAQFGSPQPHRLHWENRSQTHEEGDTMSLDASWTTYPCGGELIRYNVFIQPGFVDPGGSSSIGGDPGVNIPLHVEWSELLVCFWRVYTTLMLEYAVQRPRHEKLEFKLNSQLQPIFTDIHEPASVDSEVLTRPGADVGLPIINTKSWYTLLLSGATIQAGTYVVSTPEFEGGPLYAVAINSGGTVGSVEPAWSDILGTQITDGSVIWAMVGPTIPTDFPTWRDVSDASVVAGTVIRAQFYLPPPADIWGTQLPAPPAGTQSFQVAITNGSTQIYSNGFSGLADTSPSWPEPRFSAIAGTTTADGTVTWLSLGTGAEANPVIDIPLGLNTGARSFFPKDRGQRSIRALISMARAQLRMRARTIKITFETTIERGLDMSCRKGVIIYDHRLPGGVARGKITSYSFILDGDSQKFSCQCTAECSAGFGVESGGGITPVAGDGVYANPGYTNSGYQVMTGAIIPANPINDDVGYTPPLDAPNDDGVVFPVQDPSQLIVTNLWYTGRPPNAPQFVANATFAVSSKYIDPRTGNVTETTQLLPVPNGYTPVTWQQNQPTFGGGQAVVTYVRYYPVTQLRLELKNLNRPFASQFNLTMTPLIIPEGINLQAAQEA